MALLDVNLKAELVFPLAAELERRETPFAFLTGYDGDTLPERWRERPMLLKPVNPRDLRGPNCWPSPAIDAVHPLGRRRARAGTSARLRNTSLRWVHPSVASRVLATVSRKSATFRPIRTAVLRTAPGHSA